MRIRSTLAVCVALAASLYSGGCNKATEPSGNAANTVNTSAQRSAGNAQTTPAPAVAERISLADAKREFDAGTAVFIDTRNREAFVAERVQGALNIPISEIAANIDKLPKGKKIVVYCS